MTPQKNLSLYRGYAFLGGITAFFFVLVGRLILPVQILARILLAALFLAFALAAHRSMDRLRNIVSVPKRTRLAILTAQLVLFLALCFLQMPLFPILLKAAAAAVCVPAVFLLKLLPFRHSQKVDLSGQCPLKS